MYYFLWAIGVVAICMISAMVGLAYERKLDDKEK